MLVTGKNVVNLISRLSRFGIYEQAIIFYVVGNNFSVKECGKEILALTVFRHF